MIDSPEVLTFFFECLSGVGIGVFSNWLYNLLKEKRIEGAAINNEKINSCSKKEMEIEITIKIKVNNGHSKNKDPRI